MGAEVHIVMVMVSAMKVEENIKLKVTKDAILTKTSIGEKGKVEWQRLQWMISGSSRIELFNKRSLKLYILYQLSCLQIS